MLFADLLGRFGDVSEHQDGGYIAACPAHQDSRPSLRIWRGDNGTVRLTCRAGCRTDDVIRAVRLDWPDLFDSTGPGATVTSARPELVEVRHVAALAAYVDRASAALVDQADDNHTGRIALGYLRARFGIDPETAADLQLGADSGHQGADFRHLSRGYRAYPRLVVPLVGFDGIARGLQGRDLSGDDPARWVSLANPRGFRWSPFGVFRGAGGYGTWLVCEGPSDALSAVAVGYDSVAIRGASLSHSPELVAELAEGLRGSLVILAGDQDEAGAGFTRRLADGLAEHGVTVLVLEIPQGVGDLTEWREADPLGFPAELHRAVATARPLPVVEPAEVRSPSRELASAGAVLDQDGAADAAGILRELVDKYGESDALNAAALAAWSSGTIRYAPGLGFHVWDGRVWVRSDVRVRQEIHRMGAALVLSGDPKSAKGYTMTTRIDNLMTELKSIPGVHVAAEEFDARPDLIAFRNGVVNLKTGELGPHDQADLLTYCLDLDYDPEAECPRWLRFLAEVFPDSPDMPDYIRRVIGYGITGHTREQIFMVLWGKGANGKSVFLDALTDVFRAITKTTSFSTFEERKGGGIPNDLAALRAARLVMASEGEAGRPMSEAIIKRSTGGDLMQARFLHREFFEFRPAFLLLLATNHRPKFRSQDEGLWRRVRMIPFLRYFAPGERDYDLPRKLAAERQGIAAWAVRGAGEWYREGLRDPQVITGASREYRETSDSLAGFLPGILERADDSHQLNGSDAFNEYLTWCEAENLPAKERWTRKTFYDALEERGVSRKKTKKGIALVGLRLASASPDAKGPGIFSD
ncbi:MULTISPECIES: phage/plasmid primase, P4 family [unclassified Kitasatospora]|uniref:phage/plasmid primase, P4 family n=1 Tax=unclassified Kitasatospora TaxID=2633591 RepID=UPI003402269C